MIYIVDTHAWVEYFLGSKYGSVLKRLIDNKSNKFITMECSLAEIIGYCLKNNADFNEIHNIVKTNSFVFPVLMRHWVRAAKIKFELRKKIKDFGLIDAILMAKQNEPGILVYQYDPDKQTLTKVWDAE